MEFLMTYGWAILVVLIAIAALAAFGVFDVSIAKTDFTGQMIMNKGTALIEQTDNTVEIAFQNGLNAPITITMVGTINATDSATVCSGSGVGATKLGANGVLTVLDNTTLVRQGDTFLIKWDCGAATGINLGDKFSATMFFDYKSTDTGQTRSISGSVQGEYE